MLHAWKAKHLCQPYIPSTLVTLRIRQPINLVGAFEKPVNAGKNSEDGFVSASAKHLWIMQKKYMGTG